MHQDVHRFVADPFRLLRFYARPALAAHPVDLAALHGERDVARALVASHHFELGAGGVIVQIGVVAGRAAGRAGAEDGLLLCASAKVLILEFWKVMQVRTPKSAVPM